MPGLIPGPAGDQSRPGSEAPWTGEDVLECENTMTYIFTISSKQKCQYNNNVGIE